MSAIREQYAVALFELALEQKQTAEIGQAFERFLNAYDEATRIFFLHPNIEKNAKKEVLAALELPTVLRHFLHVLIDNNRLDAIHGIHEVYATLQDRLDETMRLRVITKEPLTSSRIEALEKTYAERYQRTVIIDPYVDERVLGGMRIEYEGMVLSDTIRDHLDTLKSRLTK